MQALSNYKSDLSWPREGLWRKLHLYWALEMDRNYQLTDIFQRY